MSRSLNSKDWLRRHLNDPYVKRATKDGYRSRAAYKLLEIDAEDKLLKPGMTVVDLGAAPGGWSQVAAAKTGAVNTAGQSRGRVVAIDLLAMPEVPGVTFIQADFSEQAGLQALVDALDGRAVDLVLSDMAPNLTGIALTDQTRMFALAELAGEFCREYLKPKGNFLIKVFQGSDYPGYIKTLRTLFERVDVKKPDASRSESNELYLLAKGKKPEVGVN